MEYLSLCRTCLSSDTSKDISELRVQQQDACSDIILFCLNIKVEGDSKVSTKLCLKCYRKIIYFYEFKTLALKNDTFLRTAESKGYVKNEIFLQDESKNDDVSICDTNEVDEFLDIKMEPGVSGNESEAQSENEFLSVIKKIKYEFISEDPIDETKENAPAKRKIGKRGRPKTTKEKPSKGATSSQVCDECGKTVKNLKEHAIQHLPPSVRKRYPCKVCEKTFASYSARNKHNRIKHLGLKKACPICNKSVVCVRAHTLLMHNSSELRYQCAPCGRRFISQSALEAHTSVHTKDRPHACDKCDKKFRSKIVLLQHMRQVHDKEKSHLCQFCSKSFFKKYHLQVHLRSHTKEKPYQCPDCDKSFSSTTILNNHRSVHSDVKSFECTLCSMTFARSGYLRVHMLSHTKEKKHPCKYCGMKFSRTDHRNRHQHTAHERHLLTGGKDIRPPARRVPTLTAKDTEALLDRQITLPRFTIEVDSTNGECETVDSKSLPDYVRI